MPDPKKTQSVADPAAHLLASSYSLYLKTQNYHWNVKGPSFNSLHTMFETQYTELAMAIDVIAERIRALGHPAPGTYGEFSELSSVKEAPGVPDADSMVRQLAEDQETLVSDARRLLHAAEKAGDEPSADLAIRRMELHQKNAWMLHSHLE